MSTAFEVVGASNANFNSCAPTPPAGSGTGFMALIFWGNSTDTPLTYDTNVWSFLGDAEGGEGAFGVDTGVRHVSAYWTEQNISTAQTFTNGNGDGSTSLTIGYILRFTKTQTYWSLPVLAEAADNVSGSTMSATFNVDPGFTAGDTAIVGIVANTDAVNPGGIAVTLPGTTQGTGTTSVVTSPFSTGNDARVTVRSMTISGTSNGTAPSITSTTDFTGGVALVRVRDSATPTTGPVQNVSAVRATSTTATVSWTHPGDAPNGVTIARASGTQTLDGAGRASSDPLYDPMTISGATVVAQGLTASPYTDTVPTPGIYTYWVARTA